MAFRSGALAASLRPLLRQQLGEFSRVAVVVTGTDLALRLNPVFSCPPNDLNLSATEKEKPSIFKRIRTSIGKIINSTWLERISILVVFINCITLTLHRPCVERTHCDIFCMTWKLVDKIALVFFLFEMIAKIIHKGACAYLKDQWHYLDMLIVVFGLLEEVLLHFQINLASIRAMRILRPVRTIEWIPSVRLLVALLWDTLPMLANVFLLSLFFFVVFGIMAVQLWAGILRQRCYHHLNAFKFPPEFPGLETIKRNAFYIPVIGDFLCSMDGGVHHCGHIPPARSPLTGRICTLSVEAAIMEWNTLKEQAYNATAAFYFNRTMPQTTPRVNTIPPLSDCINWNRVYNECRGDPSTPNPFEGAISFDNVLMAWISIFQVITLEGWSDIMYHLQDAHSFWVFLYFVPLILFGSYFLVNLCLACITIQLARSQYLYYTQNTHAQSTLSSSSVAAVIIDHWTVAGIRRAVGRIVNEVSSFLDRNITKNIRVPTDDVCTIVSLANDNDINNNNNNLSNNRTLRTQIKTPAAVETFLADTSKRSLCCSSRSFSFATLHERQHQRDHRALSHAQRRCFASTSTYSFDTGTMMAHVRDPSMLESFIDSSTDSHKNFHENNNDDSLFGDEEDVFLDPEAASEATNSYFFDAPIAFTASSSEIPIVNEVIATVHNIQSKRSSFHRQDAVCIEEGNMHADKLVKARQHCLTGVIGDNIEVIDASSVLLPLGAEAAGQDKSGDTGKTAKKRDQPRFYWRCLRAIYTNRQLRRVWARVTPCVIRWHNWLKKLLTHPITDYFFMYCIAINTFCLAIEHHDQPRVLTIIVNSVNTLFTLIFAIELVGKVICFGPGYCTTSFFNAVDTAVVFFTVVDLFGDTTFAVFRAFRLVRLFKLMEFVPSLRNTLSSLFRVVDSAITFLILLFICMYIFALFGTFLLGGRLCETEFGEPCICGQPPPGASRCMCNRKNFDSFLSSMLSVFQIFTQESWNELLYESMTKLSPWISIYFILLVMVGNFVLLNLLIAILVSGFLERAIEQNPQSGILVMGKNGSGKNLVDISETKKLTQRKGKEISSPRPQVSKNVAEASGYPKSILHRCSSSFPRLDLPGEGSHKLAYHHSQGSLSSTGASTKLEMAQLGMSITSNRQRAARRSSFSMATSSPAFSRSDFISANEATISNPSVFRTPPVFSSSVSIPPVLKNDEITSVHQISQQHSAINLRLLCRQLVFTVVNPVKAEMHTRSMWAFYCLPPENKIRRGVRQIVENPLFEGCVLALIGANCVAVAIENPNIDPESNLRRVLDIVNNIMTILFTMEMLAKMVAFGVLVNPEAYLRSGWNVLDCVLAIVCVTEMIITNLLRGASTQILSALRVLRMLRALRPLRVINSSRSLRLIVETVFSSMSEIGTVVLICFFFFLIYAIFGVQQFHGCLGRCRGMNTTNIKTRIECLLSGNRWVNDFYNFDNVFVALQTLFVFATFDNWMAIMFLGIDCVGIDKQPQENYSPFRMVYFLSFIIFCGFFLLNIFVGVVVSNFQRNFDNMKARDAAIAAIMAETRTPALRAVKSVTRNIREAFDLRHGLNRNAAATGRVSMSLLNRTPRNSECQPSAIHELIKTTTSRKASTTSRNLPPIKADGLLNIGICAAVTRWRDRLSFICTHTYFDLASGIAILLNVTLMSVEHYNMAKSLEQFILITSYIFTGLFTAEMCLRLAAVGCRRYFTEGWNIFDSAIVISSLASTIFEEMSRRELPLNATLVRAMRIAKFARVLKVLRVANTMHRIIDTVGKSLLQVGHLSLLIVLVFFIYAALGVELFGRLNWHTSQMDRDCQPGQYKCHVLGEHANFSNMGMAMLTLFRILTGDNWSGLMKDIVQMPCDPGPNCQPAPILLYSNMTQLTKPSTPRNESGEALFCCVPSLLPAIYFMSFVLVTTLCLLNLVVAVIMGSLEDSYDYQQSDATTSSRAEGESSGQHRYTTRLATAALVGRL